jgi:hypothetical protein
VLLKELLGLLAGLRGVFSQERVLVRVQRQVIGTLCALGLRNIARILGAVGRDQSPWSNEYRLFSRSPWLLRDLFLRIIQEALAFAGPNDEPIVLAGDFTHLPKSGKQIPFVSCMRDPLSPAFHTNLIYGLRFLQLTQICPFRLEDQTLPARSLPICFTSLPAVEKPGKKGTEQQWADYRAAVKKKPTAQASRRALEEAREDYDRLGAKDRMLLVALDGSFCNRVMLREPLDRVELLCRCRRDAVLCHRAKEGSRSFYSKETFSPEAVRVDETRPWQSADFYTGGRSHKIRYKEVSEVLWQKGSQRRVLRLIVLAPTGYRLHLQGRMLYRQPAFILTTDLKTPVEKLIRAYLDRWQIEVNHREEKTTMGVGDAQVRNVQSVPRQPAFTVAIYSLLLLASLKAYGPRRTNDYLPLPKWVGRPSARPSCQEMLALLRKQVLENLEEMARREIDTSALNLVLKAAA